MDLSKNAKSNRDRVEEPLFLIEKLLHDLEECQTRIEATAAVWPETSQTLEPAIQKHEEIRQRLNALKDRLASLWQDGFENKWK